MCDLSSSKRELLISTAILAPSMHNAQPWLFRFRRHAVEVYRDPRRELTAEDPDNRMTFVGVGAAVFNLRVAAATLGLRTSTVVLPDETRPLLAAEVTLESGPPDQADPELGALYPHVARRRTSRVPFEDRAVPAAIRTELEQAAACEDAALVWVEKPYRLGWLNDILLQARFADADEPRRLQERRRWVGGDRDREGVPSRSLGPRPTQVFSPVRDLAVAPADQLREKADFERHPTLGVLSTPHDGPRYWLAAGQALQRVLLVATAHGLSVSLLNQPLEHERIRWQVHDPRTAWAASQAVLRFGYGPEVPPTPRRTAAEFLLKDPTDESDRLDGADETSA
ncbi:Acg family FMN-binding oxidoreductase [Actinopolymorpha pittospori]